MHFDLQIQSIVRQQIRQLAETLKSVDDKPKITEQEKQEIFNRIQFFRHTTSVPDFTVAAVDASGDFPAVCYTDKYIYTTFAQTVIYQRDSVAGLRETRPVTDQNFHFSLLQEDEETCRISMSEAFAVLAGASVFEVIEASDYALLKAQETRKAESPYFIERSLICPAAGDAGNIGLQLRSTAELGSALRLLRSDQQVSYLLTSGTLSLPMVTRPGLSLFYEHLKRLCCVEAKKKRTVFIALTRFHGISSIEQLEELSSKKAHGENCEVAEHWYLRLPIPGVDRWQSSLAQGKRLPPAGAVTYLLRFHRKSPIFRLDLDRGYWIEYIRGGSEDESILNEQMLFNTLDYTSHDQRSYGTPYPLYSVNQRAALTKTERIALRRQIIEAAVKAGMKRSLFRETSVFSSADQE